MVVGSSPRFTLYLLAVSSLLVFATSFRRWGASRNKVSSYSPSLLPIGSCSSFNQLKQPSPLPHSLNNDEGGRFDGGDGNDGGDFHILDGDDINRYFDEYAGPWYQLKAIFLYLSNKFNRLVVYPMKKKSKISKLIVKKRLKEEIIPSTTALVHSMQSHATEQRQLKKQVKKMSKIALKKAAKKHYIDRTSTVMQDKSETMIKKSFPRVTVKRYAPFNKEEYVQQAMDRAKSKVLRPQDVQEYYNNLRQFRTH